MTLEILQKLFWKKIKVETLLEEREFQTTMKYIVETLGERGYDDNRLHYGKRTCIYR